MSLDIDVQVVPRSSRRKIQWTGDGGLKIWVASPPVEGEANQAVIELLAKTLGIPKSSISIIRGSESRRKRIRIEDMDMDAAKKRLP